MVGGSYQGVGVPDVDQVSVKRCELLLSQKLSPLVGARGSAGRVRWSLHPPREVSDRPELELADRDHIHWTEAPCIRQITRPRQV